MHKLAEISLRNRPFVALVCVVAAILGLVSLSSMKQELIPQIDLPSVSVVAISPGATSEQMSERIAVPIEQQVASIPEVKSTTSNSSSSYAMITVEVEYGTELSRATAKVEQAISRVEDSFPENTTVQATSGGSSDIPLAMVGVTTGEDALMTAQHVRAVAVPRIEKISGVASVQLIGAPAQQVTIDIDQGAAASANLAENALQDALENNGLAVPVGTVAGDGVTLDVTVGEKLSSLEDLRELPLEAANNRTVKLGDIATVELTGQDNGMSARVDGREAVALVVTPTASANIVETSQKLRDTLDEIEPMLGKGAEFSIIFDQAPFITLSINSLTKEGTVGLVMAVVVILIFLLSLRSTLVTAISIPMSLLLAFIGMFAFGYTMNVLTLSALTITIGRVVDDSIVVIENIKRHLEYGEAKRQAITTAVREVASAVTASTIVTLLVYVPVAFVSGMVGQLFKPFALTVVLAMVASLFTSLTIVPVLAYWFVKPSPAAVKARLEAGDDEQAIQKFHDDMEEAEAQTWLRKAYAPALQKTQEQPKFTLAVAVVILIISFALYPLLNVNLMGSTGQNFVSLTQTPPPGMDNATLLEHAQLGEEVLMDVAGVETVATTIGSMGLTGGGPTISYFVTTDEDADQEVVADGLSRALHSHSSGDDVETSGSSSLLSSTIDVDIVAADDDTLIEANDVLMKALENVDGAKSVTTNLQAEQPSVQITVDRDAAGAMGLTENAVVGMISSQMVSASIGQITLDNVDTDIYLKMADPVATLDELKNMTIAGRPISAIADVQEVQVVPTVVTANGQRTATISVVPDNPNDLGSLRTAVADIVDEANLPDGAMTTEAGAAEEIGTVFKQLGLAMLAAILLIYVTLVWIFKSLGQPLLLLVSIPFAAIGAFVALLVTRQPLGIASLVGLLMLIGIVVTNAIVLIDLINQYRRDGMDMDTAINMGAQRRVRPIVMTAISTIAAMIPMALGVSGQEGFISQPMAVTVIGGLFSSTALTLVLLPVLYRLTQKNWIPPELERERELENDISVPENKEKNAVFDSVISFFATGIVNIVDTITARKKSASQKKGTSKKKLQGVSAKKKTSSSAKETKTTTTKPKGKVYSQKKADAERAEKEAKEAAAAIRAERERIRHEQERNNDSAQLRADELAQKLAFADSPAAPYPQQSDFASDTNMILPLNAQSQDTPAYQETAEPEPTRERMSQTAPARTPAPSERTNTTVEVERVSGSVRALTDVDDGDFFTENIGETPLFASMRRARRYGNKPQTMQTPAESAEAKIADVGVHSIELGGHSESVERDSVVDFDPYTSDAERTIVVRSSSRPESYLRDAHGRIYKLEKDIVVLGRRPSNIYGAASVQLLPIRDEERTLSKTHACLTWRSNAWYIFDLNSSNGVLIEENGQRSEVPVGQEKPVVGTIVLGLCELTLVTE